MKGSHKVLAIFETLLCEKYYLFNGASLFISKFA